MKNQIRNSLFSIRFFSSTSIFPAARPHSVTFTPSLLSPFSRIKQTYLTSLPLLPCFTRPRLVLFPSRCVCCTAPWRRPSWFSGRPGRRVRPAPVTCGSPWDPPCPVWAWRGCPRPCSPSGRRAGGTSRAGTVQAERTFRGYTTCCMSFSFCQWTFGTFWDH